MNDSMPNRVYLVEADYETSFYDEQSPTDYTTEYIRADVAAVQLDAERKRIVDAIDAVVGLHPSFDVHLYAQAIKAAVWNDEDEPQEILKRELGSMPK